jgi:hypothetical protein
MPSVIKSVSFDAADALALARFWSAAFGSVVDEDSTADCQGTAGLPCGRTSDVLADGQVMSVRADS